MTNEQMEFFPPVPPRSVSWLYAGCRGGQIKIGVTNDPARRARELGIQLMRTTPGGRQEESALHRQFKRSRIDREWFMPTPEVLAWVTAKAA